MTSAPHISNAPQQVDDSNNRTNHNKRHVIINVDDLGLSPAVNQAVIHLAKNQRISATSYMTGGHLSADELQTLLALPIDIGLHFDLTGIFKSTLTHPLKQLIIKSYLRQIDKKQAQQVINQQLDEFEDTFGHAPVFIDGHQHIHQLPVIRNCLTDILVSRYGQGNIAARVTTPLRYDIKSWIIYLLGGYAWRQLCQQNHIAYNDVFGGVYDFNASIEKLATLWDDWLQHSPKITSTHSTTNHLAHTTLIMCHPALPVGSGNPTITPWEDEIKPARECEYQWLMSDDFAQLCTHHQVALSRWSA